MELSAEILHATVGSLKPETGERRKHQRIPFRFKVKAIPYEEGTCGEPFFIWTRDICEGGLGLIYHKSMKEGRKFIIRLSRQEDTPLLMLCTVRNCLELTTNVFGIGATFTEVAETAVADPSHKCAPGATMPEIESIHRAADLTEEIRRISDAILG